MIAGLAPFQQVMWAANIIVNALLLLLLLVRKNYTVYPAFTSYILINLVLSLLLIPVYLRWHFFSTVSWGFAWSMEATAVCARGLAVAEICKHVLQRYSGIWGLAKRILLLLVGVVAFYSIWAGHHEWKLMLPVGHRAIELSMATVIVVLFVLTRYYDVPVDGTDRSVAIGFCLYCCFQALNDTISDRYLSKYAEIWSLLRVLTFFASLLLWAWAFRKQRTWDAEEESLLAPETYHKFNPEVNMRLRTLNEHLSKILGQGVTRH